MHIRNPSQLANKRFNEQKWKCEDDVYAHLTETVLCIWKLQCECLTVYVHCSDCQQHDDWFEPLLHHWPLHRHISKIRHLRVDAEYLRPCYVCQWVWWWWWRWWLISQFWNQSGPVRRHSHHSTLQYVWIICMQCMNEVPHNDIDHISSGRQYSQNSSAQVSLFSHSIEI